MLNPMVALKCYNYHTPKRTIQTERISEEVYKNNKSSSFSNFILYNQKLLKI